MLIWGFPRPNLAFRGCTPEAAAIRVCLTRLSKCCVRHTTALVMLNLTRWTTPSKAEPQMTPTILEEWEAFRRPKDQDSWLIFLCVPWMSMLAFLFHYSSNGGAGIFESANNFPQLLPAPFPALSFILKGLRTQKMVKFRCSGHPSGR